MTIRTVMQSHWIGFLFLLPFLVMIWVRDALGLSDAFLLARDQRDRDSQLFNLVMVAVFYVGIASFVAHALYLRSRGRQSLSAKLLFLAVYWTAILLLR
jgi:hypothetical protein